MRLRRLRTLHGGVARDFGAALSTMLRGPVDVRLAGVDQRSYGEFLDHLGTPTCFYVLNAAALDERVMLEIEPSILYPMIERLLGGKGNKSNLPERPEGCVPTADRTAFGRPYWPPLPRRASPRLERRVRPGA